MHPLRICVCFLLIAVGAQAKDLYSIRTLSEKEKLEMYSSMLKDASIHADHYWTNVSAGPRVGYWGTGRSDEPGVRSITCMVLANGAILKCCGNSNDSEREGYK